MRLVLLAAAILTAHADDTFFEKNIRPVLAEKCWSCHSTQAKLVHAGLKLDDKSSRDSVITPHKPEDSRLYKALLYTGATKMPPTGKLPPETLENFKIWIAGGAPWPATTVNIQTATHWAWNPIANPPVPPVRNTAWPRNPIDNFILAKLEAQNLQPAPGADPATWLRRVTLDLTGLPPTPAEQDEFATHKSPEKVVDRLLQSEAFGHRWARHWLDQTYYADNIEIGRRVPARHAWRYRDYVIDAINRDIPYSQFVQQQIAGDHLPWTTPAERRANLSALGFLALGPWPLVNADKVQLQMDVVDLQVDMVGRSFLGLTMGCARCHDHKFDPISLKDYYGMAGIFASTRTINGRLGLGVFSNVNTVTLPELPEEMTARAAETTEYWRNLAAARKNLEELKKTEKPDPKAVTAADNAVKLLLYLPPTPPTVHAVQDAETPADIRINLRGNAHQLGAETPRSGVALTGKIAQLDIPDYTSGRKELAAWITDKANPLPARVAVNRAWHHLFGAGIVPTIDNFGTRGLPPSHPELLDFLAASFTANNGSLKQLVKQIVLSRTYAQSAAPNPKAQEIDPENRLQWRMSRRRLEGETIRDAILSVTGNLDPHAGGPALPFQIKGNLSLGEPESFIEDVKLDPATRLRRSIFLPVLRKSQAPELDILNLFNFPDTNQITGARQSTTIPTQALYLMNAPWVQEQAAALAERLQANQTTTAEKLRQLVRRVFAREPRNGELAQLEKFLATFPETESWKRLCHSLLISNEFLYRN